MDVDFELQQGSRELITGNISPSIKANNFNGIHNTRSNTDYTTHECSSTKLPEVMISDLQAQLHSGLVVLPPERPPKPPHLVIASSNDSQTKSEKTDKTRNFSHSAENYANAADMQDLYRAEQDNNIGNEVQYQSQGENVHFSAHSAHHSQFYDTTKHPIPASQNTESTAYEFQQGPLVSRELKPNRKNITSRNRSQTIGCDMMSSYVMPSSTSNRDESSGRLKGSQFNVLTANTLTHNFATLGPPVVRALKPQSSDMIDSRSRFNSVDLTFVESSDQTNENELNCSRRNSTEDEQIYYYMPPINTTSGLGGVHSTHPPLMIPAESFEHPSISYIDLDLPKTASPTTKNLPNGLDQDAQKFFRNPVADIPDAR